MASQDRSLKYIGSLTEGPSLTSGCGMACCPWTAYACKERKALRRVWQCHTQRIPISISTLSLVCHKNKDRLAGDRTPVTGKMALYKLTLVEGRNQEEKVLYLTTCKDDRGAWGFGSVRDGHSLWWRLRKTQVSTVTTKAKRGISVVTHQKKVSLPQAWQHRSAWHTQ